MFTLKLYGNGRIRIVSAESFTVYQYNNFACQITAHQKDQGDDRCFYVGDDRACDVAIISEREVWYSRAFIENASGRTSEVIEPPPMPRTFGEGQSSEVVNLSQTSIGGLS